MTALASTPKMPNQVSGAWACCMAGAFFAIALLVMTAPASAGGWNVAVGVSSGGGYRPIAYGPGFGRGYWNGGPYGYGGWGTGWNAAWGNGWGYPAYPGGFPYAFSPPPAVYVQPVAVEPIVLAAQPQPPVWYFCASAAQYFPNIGACPEGWQVQSALPPPQTQGQQKPPNAGRIQ